MSTNSRVCIIALLLAMASLVARAATCPAPPSGLASWWPGDADANDLAGGNNPSAVNGVSFVPGEVLDGFSFGSNGYLEIPAAPNLANQRFTWAAWVNPQGAYADQYGSVIVVQNDTDFSDVIALDWRNTPDSRFLFVFGNQTNEIIYSTDTFPAGSFYHVAGTYDGKVFRLYVNGVLQGSFKESKTVGYSLFPWGIGESFILGVGSGFRNWMGVIDEVQAFNRALSAFELLTIYKAGSRGECKGLLLNPAKLTFATQAVGTESPAQTVTVTNISGATVSLTSISFAGIDRGDFAQTNNCGSTLPADGSCAVNVTFTPSAIGSRKAALATRDNAAGSPQKVRVAGTGD